MSAFKNPFIFSSSLINFIHSTHTLCPPQDGPNAIPSNNPTIKNHPPQQHHQQPPIPIANDELSSNSHPPPQHPKNPTKLPHLPPK